MPPDEFERFRLEVLADRTLQVSLRAIGEPDAFAAEVVRLGGERGYAFGADDVRAAIRQASMAWQLRRVS